MLISIFIVPLVVLAIHQAYVQYSAVFSPSIYEKIASCHEDDVTIFKNNRLEEYTGCLESVYKESSFSKNNLEENAFDLKKTLHFSSVFIENQYREFYIFENLKSYKIIIVLLFALLVL